MYFASVLEFNIIKAPQNSQSNKRAKSYAFLAPADLEVTWRSHVTS